MRQLELGVHPPPAGPQKKPKEKARRSPQVPAQFLGYSLQQTRLLQLLLDGQAGAIYSLEVFEDVGEELKNGHRLASQTKSSLTGNPISDGSPELWKTLANWADSAAAGHLPPEKTIFELYVSGPKSGRIAEAFSRATSEAEARSAILSARKVLSTSSTTEQKVNAGGSRSAKGDVKRFFSAEEEIVVGIVRNFRLTTGSGSPIGDVRLAFEKMFVPPELVEVVLQQALGWIKQKTDSLLEKGQPAAVAYDEFKSEITAFVRKCSAREILVSWAGKPSAEDVEGDLLRTYVRQLELIDCDDDEKFHAINDFLLASVDRTNWSKAGLVHHSSFEDFEIALVAFWKNRRRQTEIIHKKRNPLDRGKLVYSDCSSHRRTLEGLEVPDHFTPGSFHALADEQDVGWHPDYEARLSSSREKKSGTKKS